MSEDDQASGKIINFEEHDRSFDVEVEKWSYDPDRCEHRQATINGRKGTLQCRKCNAYIDPFIYLLNMANNRALLKRQVNNKAEVTDALIELEQMDAKVRITKSTAYVDVEINGEERRFKSSTSSNLNHGKYGSRILQIKEKIDEVKKE